MAAALLGKGRRAAAPKSTKTASSGSIYVDNPAAVTSLRDNAGYAPLCRGCASRSHCEAARLLSFEYDHFRIPFIRTYMLRRNEYLYYQGDPARSIYIVRSGSLKSCLSLRDQNEYILGFHLTGDALLADVLGTGVHGSSTIALEETSVCIVPMMDLNVSLRRLSGWYKWTLELADREITRAHYRTLMLRSTNAEGRVTGFLLSIATHFREQGYSDRTFSLSMSRQDISNYLGLTVETVSRTLSRLKNTGLLALDRRQVTIKDPAKLRSMAEVTGAY